MKNSNQLTRFMAEIILAIFILSLGFLSNISGQESKSSLTGDTLFISQNYTLRYYTGIIGTTFPNLEKADDVNAAFKLRLGLMSKYEFTNNFGVNFDVMGNFSTNAAETFGASNIGLYYNPGKFSFVVGKTASPITCIRPYPVSWPSQVEYFSTMILGANKYTLKASYSLGEKLTFNIGAGEFGKTLGDSTQYSVKLDYSGFSFGVYNFEGKDLDITKGVGLVAKYCSPYFEVFASYKQELVSSYVQFVLSKKYSLYFATDFVYDYSISNEFGKDSDYLEVMLMQFFDLGNLIQNKVEGMYGLGITNGNYLTLYFGLHF